MSALSLSQLNTVTKLTESMGEKLVFATNVEKQHKLYSCSLFISRRKQRIEKRIVIITEYKVITLRPGLMTGYRIAREAPIWTMNLLTLDDYGKITIGFDEWGIVFHTIQTEPLVVALWNRYNVLCMMIPTEKRASIHINESLISHATITEAKLKPNPNLDPDKDYSEALRITYGIMCNKYKSEELNDIKDMLTDKFENGNKKLVLKSDYRIIDAPQCAAIIETLQWDEWFTELVIKDIQGADVIIPALRNTLITNKTIHTIVIDGIKTSAKTMLFLGDAFVMNKDNAIRSLTFNHIPLSVDFITAVLPVLPPITSLTFLHCQLNQNATVHLFNTLMDCPNLTNSLQSLDISFNTLGPDGTTALASWLMDCLPSINLTELKLAGCNIAWPILINTLKKHELNIKTLDISSHQLYDKVFCVLNPFIAEGYIHNLTIGDMRGDLSMVEGICASLLLNHSISETKLAVDNTDMNYALQERLISLVSQSSSICELSLRNCQMDDICMSTLCDVLTTFPNCQVKRLLLDGNLHMPEVASLFLCALLKQSSIIEEVSLSGCHGILVSQIAEGLQASSSIKHFYMNDCGLMDEDIAILCDSVINHSSLITLELDGNNIMVEGYKKINEMLKGNKTITCMGNLRSLPEIEKLYSEEDRITILNYRRNSFILMMQHEQM